MEYSSEWSDDGVFVREVGDEYGDDPEDPEDPDEPGDPEDPEGPEDPEDPEDEDPEDGFDRDVEGWTDDDFFARFPQYRAGEEKRNSDYLLRWHSCPAYHVRRTSRVVTRFFDQEIRDVVVEADRLRSTQIPVLCCILQCDGRERMREIARLLFMDPSTLTRSVHILERRGLVERVVARGDRRMRTVRITKEGERVLLANLGGWRRSRALFQDRFREGPNPPRIEQRRAFVGVTTVFEAGRRCLHARGLRWEMRAPPPPFWD